MVSIEVVQSWGVASARNTSGFPLARSSAEEASSDSSSMMSVSDAEYIYEVPIGLSIVRWDLTSRKRLMQFQAHSDLVTCARRSPDEALIASSSYSGGVKVWSPQWHCLATAMAPMESQFHLAWSWDSKSFLVIGNGKNSAVVVYTVEKGKEDCVCTLRLEWVLLAKDCPHDTCTGAGDDEGEVKTTDAPASGSQAGATHHDSGKNYPYENAFYMAEFNPSGHIFSVEEIPYRTTLIHLLSPAGQVLETADLMAGMGDTAQSRRSPVNTVFLSTYHDGVYAIGLEGGRVAMVDAVSLQLNRTFKVGSGFRTALWDGDALIVSSDSGKVAWWSREGERVCEFESCVQDYVVRMNWSRSGNGIWICGFSCLAYLAVDRSDAGFVKGIAPSFFVHCHELTSVGVGFDPSGKLVGSGDMAGNVWVTEKDKTAPIHTFTVNGSVRCLEWVSREIMMVGTLEGGLHYWRRGDSQPHLLLQRHGSIICSRFNTNHKLLAVGTSKGMLCVYDIELEGGGGGGGVRYDTVVEMKAHPPHEGPQDQRFGQLGKQAEIWSLCWSPDEAKLATCSEDQTLKVWSTDNWKCLATLRGHSLAVTSVDWIQYGTWSLLASCSDDRTIRLSNGEDYSLLCVVDTKDIDGWHTLTYLTFYRPCELLLCTTQNGHLVVWKIQSNDRSLNNQQQKAGQSSLSDSTHLQPDLCRIWKGKVHLGSVEGLVWQNVTENGGVATVGADCIVNLFKIS